MQPILSLEEYEASRRELCEKNANLSGVVLSEDERRLDEKLKAYKREFFASHVGGDVFGLSPLRESALCESALYRFLDRLPKGADLHVHDMALLPLGELIPVILQFEEFVIDATAVRGDLKWIPAGEPVPEGYVRFSEAWERGLYTGENLRTLWTAVGAEGSGMGIWDFFEELFCRQEVLSSNPAFAAVYYDRAFRYYIARNIRHVEIHVMLTDSLDASLESMRVVREAYYTVRREHPEFTVRVIGAGVKADDEKIAFTKKCFLNASYVQEMLKDEFFPEEPEDFLIGFDLVNEEDASLPLSAFAPMLLKVRRQYPAMKLYIHGGESLSATNENLIDAYLLGAHRVGHGLNLYRYPDLHARYAAREICLEVCPVSNQVLGYARDIRTHPATEYLKTGVPLALCSDDPAYMEKNTLTDDYFAAVVGWDLAVAELKQLGFHSLFYSGLGEAEKSRALKDFARAWRVFCEEELGGDTPGERKP